jgi:hypothetical protein
MGTKVAFVLEPELCATGCHLSSFLGIAEPVAPSKLSILVTISTGDPVSPNRKEAHYVPLRDKGMRFWHVAQVTD